MIGRHLARYLSQSRPRLARVALVSHGTLAATLEKGDVLLIEGSSRFSHAIKYLTHSGWSHAALYVGDSSGTSTTNGEALSLLEVDINEGVRAVPLSTYSHLQTRICRSVGLSSKEIDEVVHHAMSRIGQQYDLKNILDLARYLIQTPPVPSRWRRRLLAIGSGDPTRAICSSMIAEAFQSIRYPVLPEKMLERSDDPACIECHREVLHIRHHSLFVPRDFDMSPYFQIVKPILVRDFDPHSLNWGHKQVADPTGNRHQQKGSR